MQQLIFSVYKCHDGRNERFFCVNALRESEMIKLMVRAGYQLEKILTTNDRNYARSLGKEGK